MTDTRIDMTPQLQSIAAIQYGLTAKSSPEKIGPKFLRITDIQNGAVDWSSVPRCEVAEDRQAKFQLAPGDIVFARTGATTGKSFLITEEVDAVFASYLIRVKPKAGDVSSRYLAYYFQTSDYWEHITAGTEGAAQGGFNASKLGELRIPLPPFDEQKRIVAVLDQAFAALDRVRAQTEANLKDARLIFERTAKSIFLAASERAQNTKLVSGIAENRKGSIRTGPFGSQLKHGEFVDSGIRVLGIDNAVRNTFQWGKPRHITEEKYAQLSRYRVFPGDVIITIMGTCGRCAIIPPNIPKAVNTKHLCCITLNQEECLPEYLHRYFLLSPKALEYLASQTKGTVMDGLNMGIIKDLPVDLPGIDEQKNICRKVRNLEEQTEALSSRYATELNNISELRQSLLQQAFEGQLT